MCCWFNFYILFLSQVYPHLLRPAAWRPQPLLPPQVWSWAAHIPQQSPPRCSRRPSDARSSGEPAGRPQRCESERNGGRQEKKRIALFFVPLSPHCTSSSVPPSQFPALLAGEQRTLPPPRRSKPHSTIMYTHHAAVKCSSCHSDSTATDSLWGCLYGQLIDCFNDTLVLTARNSSSDWWFTVGLVVSS